MSVTAIESVEQFNTVIKSEKAIVIMFSAPWCGSCKMIFPKIEKLADDLKEAEFYKLNADEELEELVDELEVERFPTFRVYKNGEVVNEYTGSLVEKIEAFIRTNLNP